MIIDENFLLAAAGAVTVLAFAWGTIQGISSYFKKKRTEYRQSILDQAYKEIKAVKQELEEKISKVALDLESQKENVARDLGAMQDTYNSEIKVLGNQIKELRADLNTQHSNLVALLTKLVDNR